MQRRTLLAALALALPACSDQLPTAPGISYDIADAARGYKAGFYWLPPIVKTPVYDGTFDVALSPAVEICQLEAGVCVEPLASFSGDQVTLSIEDEHYHVNWHTDQYALSTSAFYRVSVRAGDDVLLGYADVQPVNNGSGLKNVDTDEYIGLVDGRTLPIKFRIETGIVASIEVQPIEATTDPGSTQQFVAIVKDLHGNIISADVAWATSDEAVATVDQTGLATAVGDGTATITATADHISGSAMLTVEGGVVAIVSSGRAHACALAEDGRAFCWGRNDAGQLGDGTLLDRTVPTAVLGGLRFITIAAGDFHTCGITDSGAAYCWGLNQNAEVGDGTTIRRTAPVAVLGGHTFASISTGSSNTCALTPDQQAYCWGQGSFGAVGNGSTTARVSSPALVSGGHAWAMISSGQQFTCGVTSANQAYCWGNGGGGKLGNGSTANRLTPFPVAGGHAFTTIHGGDSHTCAISTDQAGYCWGAGQFGRLGNGSTVNVAVPTLVSGNISWAQINAGGLHSCGVSTSGVGYCWGGNVDGNLGTGSLFSALVPTLVVGGHSWTHIIPSGQFQGPGGGSIFSFTCGVTIAAETLCWGSNFFGQLGDGTRVAQGEPGLIAPFPE